MNKYEILYIIDNDVDDEKKAALVDRFSELVVSLGGEVEGVDKWGTKRFAYPINYKNDGYYVLMNFNAEATVPTEIDRQMKNTDSIVRQMIIRK
jgi:ribosomal protein S6